MTLLDVEVLAVGLGLTLEATFERYIAAPHVNRPGVFAQARTETGACTLRGPDGKCSVPWFRPRTCAFVPCPKQQRGPSTACRGEWQERAAGFEQWQHKLAESYTQQYIAEQGARWCAPLFARLTAELRSAIREKAHELGMAAPRRAPRA